MTRTRNMSDLLDSSGDVKSTALDNATITALSGQTNTATDFLDMPAGTTAQRPSSPATGHIRFNTTLNLMEYYDGNGWKAIDSAPLVTSISPTTSTTANENITITGSFFASGATVKFIGNDGTEYSSPSVTFTDDTTLVAQTPSTVLTASNEPYDVQVTNPSGLSGVLADGLDAGGAPTWTTSSGSLMGSKTLFEGEILQGTSVAATDPDGQTVSYALNSGSSLPSGLSLNTSTGAITGDPDSVSSDTTTTFTVNASAGGDTTGRSFSMVTTNDESAAYESNLKIWLRAGWNGQGTVTKADGNTWTAAKYGSTYNAANEIIAINTPSIEASSDTNTPANGSGTYILDALGGNSNVNTLAKQKDDMVFDLDAGDSIWVDDPPFSAANNQTFCYWFLVKNVSANTSSSQILPVFHSWSGTSASAYIANDWYTNGTSNIYMSNYASGALYGTWYPSISGGSNGRKGIWFHVGLVYTSGTTKCYLNGSLDATLTGPTSWPSVGSNQTCNFNGRGDGLGSGKPGNYTTGDQPKKLADIRYYDAALSAGAIMDIYNKSRSSFM